jgi:hypothetical protein
MVVPAEEAVVPHKVIATWAVGTFLGEPCNQGRRLHNRIFLLGWSRSLRYAERGNKSFCHIRSASHGDRGFR